MTKAASFVVGLVFAFGLVLSGMTLPSKVIGFFDFSDGLTSWDPSLGLVMGGAMLVYIPVYRLVTRRRRPLWEPEFKLPTRTDIDRRLVVGSALFGAGWGLGGFCPGPALTSVGSFSQQAFIFVAAMLFGMIVFRHIDAKVLQ